MFGIGKVLSQVLDQHGLSELSGRIDTDSVEGMRNSLEALGASGDVDNVGGLLKDISTQLSGVLKDVGENLTHMVEDLEVEVGGDLIRSLDVIGAAAAAGADQPSQSQPVEAELVPHEAVHTLQGVAVEDDSIIATEAEAPAAATVEPAHAEEAGETADD